jgi:small subunit ribosomal protein S6
MILLDNREVRNGWQALKDSVAAIFTKHGAEVVSSKRWDERRLAYPIKGQLRGTYLLAYVKSDTQQVVGIRRDLQFNESVLRSMMLVCEEVPQSAFEPEAAFDHTAVAIDDAPSATETAAEQAAAAEPTTEGAPAPDSGAVTAETTAKEDGA